MKFPSRLAALVVGLGVWVFFAEPARSSTPENCMNPGAEYCDPEFTECASACVDGPGWYNCWSCCQNAKQECLELIGCPYNPPMPCN